jgi:hypothetical protein
MDTSNYNELEKVRKNMERYKPLTPNLRAKIDDAFDKQIEELKTCQPNSLVMIQINALQTSKKLIHWLPDGYPISMKNEG